MLCGKDQMELLPPGNPLHRGRQSAPVFLENTNNGSACRWLELFLEDLRGAIQEEHLQAGETGGQPGAQWRPRGAAISPRAHPQVSVDGGLRAGVPTSACSAQTQLVNPQNFLSAREKPQNNFPADLKAHGLSWLPNFFFSF